MVGPSNKWDKITLIIVPHEMKFYSLKSICNFAYKMFICSFDNKDNLNNEMAGSISINDFFMQIFRMTLLLGPPSAGKTTLLQALAGKLDHDLRVSFSVCLRIILLRSSYK